MCTTPLINQVDLLILSIAGGIQRYLEAFPDGGLFKVCTNGSMLLNFSHTQMTVADPIQFAQGAIAQIA
eukprot:1159624-Pelagomonas_calceolata.AAC.3